MPLYDDIAAMAAKSTASITRMNYVTARMDDLPQVYKDLLPTSSDLRELATAEKEIRSQAHRDLSAANVYKPSSLDLLKQGMRENPGKSLLERQMEAAPQTQSLTHPAVPGNPFELLKHGLGENPGPIRL